MNKEIRRLMKKKEDLDRWIGQTFSEQECKKINELIEVELLLKAECNK